MIAVQEDDFDLALEQAALAAASADVGAVACFTGYVRGGDGLQSMTLEHYPGMTERALGAIIEEAKRRWPLQAVRVVHRVGCLRPGERIVFVGVASRHRSSAFAACEFIMDWLKTRAPFWKKEAWAEGERWVEARASDEAAAARW